MYDSCKYIHTYIHANLYSAKNRENESEALKQDDQTAKADWKRWNFRWRLKVDWASIERMCAGSVPSRRCRHRKGPRGKVASNTGWSGKEICIGRTQGPGWKILRNELFYFPIFISGQQAAYVSACFYARLSCLHCQTLATCLMLFFR